MKRILVAMSLLLIAVSLGPICRADQSHVVYLPLLLMSPGVDAVAEPGPDPGPCVSDDANWWAYEELIALINEERVADGLASLTPSGELAEAARRHTEDMVEQGSLCHIGSDGSTPGQRIRAARYEWLACGEVVALGPGCPRVILNLWLRSPDHRAILTDGDLRDVGVARAPDPAGRGYYWTVDLGIRQRP